MDEPYITTILWRHKLIVAACVAVAIAAAVAATLLADRQYEARATLQAGALADRGGGSAEGNQALARSYAEVLTSGSFLERVRSELPGTPGVRELQERLSAEAIPETSVIRLKVRADAPAAARSLAAGITASFIATLRNDTTGRVQRRQRELEALIEQLTERIDAAPAGTAASRIEGLRASRQALVQQGAEMLSDGIAEAASARRVGPPSASSDPVSPRPKLNLLSGVVFGLLLGAGLAWWRERQAQPLHSAEEAAGLAKASVLATIPLRRRVSADDPVLVEAYDILRANLTFQSRADGFRVIAVTGENARVGKSSTVEGLAYAAERAGARVAVVDADLRLAELSTRLGYRGGASLADVIEGDASIDEALVELVPGLVLLPARQSTPDPPSLLSSTRMHNIIAILRLRFDLILIDSPPTGQLADGLLVSAMSDAALLVVRAGSTSRPDLTHGARKVRQTQTPIVGLVVFAPQAPDTAYYPLRPKPRPRAEHPTAVR